MIESLLLLFNNPEIISGAEGLRVEFDRQCSTERRHDPLTVMDGANRIVSVRSGDLIIRDVGASLLVVCYE